MNKVYLTSYAVKGIKNLDEWAELSFYKKTIDKPFSIQNYNVKGIYGINGAGKSGIIRSVEIMKYLISNPYYLSDQFVQKQLNDLINKNTKTLEIKTEYLYLKDDGIFLYRYEIKIEKNRMDLYSIAFEKLSSKRATSYKAPLIEVYHTEHGTLSLSLEDVYASKLVDRSRNLLSTSSLPAVFLNNEELLKDEDPKDAIRKGLTSLLFYVSNIFIFMDQGDDHRSFYINKFLENREPSDDLITDELINAIERLKSPNLSVFAEKRMFIIKDVYPKFEKTVEKLSNFIKTFKNDLKGIGIDKREDEHYYICSLIMKYESYSIDAEFESTGIKKLIKIFDYFYRMMNGGIVFIDELDSNLHDVYLCALLEYLMNNADGQLCFTTHNIGPMDILKKNKKSIDFLSTDHKIYSWAKNGNYSPSSLYKNGMIEGSAFNVFPFDFAGAFYSEENE